MDTDLYFEVIFILEFSCREDMYFMELRKNFRFMDEKDTFSVSLMRDEYTNNYHKTFNLIRSQLKLLFELLDSDFERVNDYINFDKLKWDSFYGIQVNKYVVKRFMKNFQKSQLWEEYINYKSKKEAQRVRNLLKYDDINPAFLNKDPYYLNKNKHYYLDEYFKY
jgi:hypothetical protein